MASGILGQSAPSATTNTTVYTVPSSTTATFNVNVVNTGTSVATIRLAISATGTPSTSEWVEYNSEVVAGGVLERSGFVAQATKNVVVYTDTATVSVSVYGYEA
jgi:hypothetical protein